MTEEKAAFIITRFAKRMQIKINTKKELMKRMGKHSEFLSKAKKQRRNAILVLDKHLKTKVAKESALSDILNNNIQKS